MRKIVSLKRDGLICYVTKDIDTLKASILETYKESVINLGSCPESSFLMTDILGYITQFSFNAMYASHKHEQIGPSRLLLLTLTKDTDYNTVEQLNKKLEEAGVSSNYHMMIIIDDSELVSSRFTASVFSRLIPFRKSLDMSLFIDAGHGKIRSSKKCIDVVAEPYDLLHVGLFDFDSQVLSFSSTFQERVEFEIKDCDDSEVEICFHVDVILPEYETLMETLTITGQLIQYDIDFRSLDKQLSFKCVPKKINLKEVLEPIKNQFKPYTNIKNHALKEITTYNINYVLKQELVVEVKDGGGYDALIEAPVDAIYIATKLSSSDVALVIDWLSENKDRCCFLGSSECIDDVSIKDIQRLSSSDGNLKRVSYKTIFNSAKDELPLCQYDSYWQPGTVHESRLCALNYRFLITDSDHVEHLRSQMNKFNTTPFYVTPSVYDELVHDGPFLNTDHIILLEDLPELKKEVLTHIPTLEDYVSDTILMRVAYLLHKDIDLSTAIQKSITDGLPPHCRPDDMKDSVSLPTSKTYLYSQNGLSTPMSPILYDGLEVITKLTMMVDVSNIRCVTPISNDSHSLREILNSGGFSRLPVWVEPDETIKEITSDISLLELEKFTTNMLTKASRILVIGQAQERMISDISSDVLMLLEASKQKTDHACTFNTRLILGAAGVGKDELCQFINQETDITTLLCQDVFSPLKLDDYKHMIDRHLKESQIGLLNLQEINLTKDHISAFETLVLYAKMAGPHVYILATGNNFSSRASITPTIEALLQQTTVGSLTRDDIVKGIHHFIPTTPNDPSDLLLKDTLLTLTQECVFQDKMNFRFLSFIIKHCSTIKTDNERLSYLNTVFNVQESVSDEVESNVSLHEQIEDVESDIKSDNPPPLSLSTLFQLLFLGVLFIGIKQILFPWLMTDSRTLIKWPVMPSINTDTIVFGSKKDFELKHHLDCRFLPEIHSLIYDVSKGTVSSPHDHHLLGHLPDPYWRRLLSSNYLTINEVGDVYGLSSMDQLEIVAYSGLASDLAVFNEVVSDLLGTDILDVLISEIKQQTTIDEKVAVVKDFYVSNFKYNFLPVTMHPNRVADIKEWLVPFLQYRTGVCSHFAHFAQLLLESIGIEEPIAVVKTISCGSNMLHEELLVGKSPHARLIDVTIPMDVEIDYLSTMMIAIGTFVLGDALMNMFMTRNETSAKEEKEPLNQQLTITIPSRRVGVLMPHKVGPKDWAKWKMITCEETTLTFTPKYPLTQQALMKRSMSIYEIKRRYNEQNLTTLSMIDPKLHHYFSKIEKTTTNSKPALQLKESWIEEKLVAYDVDVLPDCNVRLNSQSKHEDQIDTFIIGTIRSALLNSIPLEDVIITAEDTSKRSLLYLSIRRGSEKSLNELIEHGYNAYLDRGQWITHDNDQLSELRSSLLAVSFRNAISALNFLKSFPLLFKNDVGYQSFNDKGVLIKKLSCLYISSENGHSGIVRELKSGGYSFDNDFGVQTFNDQGILIKKVSCLFIALQMGHSGVVNALKSVGYSFDNDFGFQTFNDQGILIKKVSCLFIALQRGHSGVVNALKSVGYSFNNDFGFQMFNDQGILIEKASCLYIASKMGHSGIINALKSGGYSFDNDVGVQTFNDQGILIKKVSCLYISSKMGHSGVINALKSGGYSFENDFGFQTFNDQVILIKKVSCLYISSENGHSGIVRELKSAGYSFGNDFGVQMFNDQGILIKKVSCLYISSENGHSGIVRELKSMEYSFDNDFGLQLFDDNGLCISSTSSLSIALQNINVGCTIYLFSN